jgi:hypothetical protein
MTDQDFTEIALEVLSLFRESGTEGLDLHTFFEVVAGDDQSRRYAVLNTVEQLEAEGYLESRGSDFYTVTEEGMKAAVTGRLDRHR